jgi:hypothetical protein
MFAIPARVGQSRFIASCAAAASVALLIVACCSPWASAGVIVPAASTGSFTLTAPGVPDVNAAFTGAPPSASASISSPGLGGTNAMNMTATFTTGAVDTLYLESTASCGEGQTTSGHFSYTFTVDQATYFSMEVEGTVPLHSNYTVNFNGIVADHYYDPLQFGGWGGSIPVMGTFDAAGFLAAGSYTITVDALQSPYKNIPTSGEAGVQLALAPASSVPLSRPGALGGTAALLLILLLVTRKSFRPVPTLALSAALLLVAAPWSATTASAGMIVPSSEAGSFLLQAPGVADQSTTFTGFPPTASASIFSPGNGLNNAMNMDVTFAPGATQTITVTSSGSCAAGILQNVYGNFSYTFSVDQDTWFDFQAVSQFSMHSGYTASFNGITANHFFDSSAPGGWGGNIPLTGAFDATGILAAGTYTFTVAASQYPYHGYPTSGGGLATLALSPAPGPAVPLSRASVLAGAAAVALAVGLAARCRTSPAAGERDAELV